MRDLVERDVTTIEAVKDFSVAGYQFDAGLSSSTVFKFIRESE